MPPSHFALIILETGSNELFALPGRTSILLISTTQEAGITAICHWWLAHSIISQIHKAVTKTPK
jgi:hypothetical protein